LPWNPQFLRRTIQVAVPWRFLREVAIWYNM